MDTEKYDKDTERHPAMYTQTNAHKDAHLNTHLHIHEHKSSHILTQRQTSTHPNPQKKSYTQTSTKTQTQKKLNSHVSKAPIIAQKFAYKNPPKIYLGKKLTLLISNIFTSKE